MTTKINSPQLLDAKSVRQYHRIILRPGQLDGESDTRTIESVLARVENHVYYGSIQDDVIEVAAAYAVAISRGHCFVDGNKRTALLSMLMFLRTHGFDLEIDQTLLATTLEHCAAGEITDDDLWQVIFEHLRDADS